MTNPASAPPAHAATGGTWRMVAAMALSGTIGAFVVMSGQPPIDVVWFRCLLGGLALLGALALQRGWRPMDTRQWSWLALGGIALILNWICLFSAYRYSGISIATVVYHTQPFFLLWLVALFQRERVGAGRLPWLLLAFAGVVLITGLKHGGSGTPGRLLAGVALSWLRPCCMPSPPSPRAGCRACRRPRSPACRCCWECRCCCRWPTRPGQLRRAGLGALLALGLLHTGVMYTWLYAAFQRLGVLSIATLSFIYPLVAIAIDVLVFRVVLSPAQLAGMAPGAAGRGCQPARLATAGRTPGCGPLKAAGPGRAHAGDLPAVARDQA